MPMLRQRDVYARIYVSPREVEQCVAKRKGSPSDDTGVQPLAHPGRDPRGGDAPSRSPSARRVPQDVYERASTGEDFAQLAIAYSDAGTALEGGALGWRKAGQLPSFVAEVIPTMKPATSPSRSARRAACTSSSCSRCAAPSRPRSCRRCTRGTS